MQWMIQPCLHVQESRYYTRQVPLLHFIVRDADTKEKAEARAKEVLKPLECANSVIVVKATQYNNNGGENND